MQAVLDQIDRAMALVLGNPYLSSALTLFLVLYAGLAAPNLPPFVASLFENPLFKLLILFLVLIVRNYNPTVAILTTIGFVLSMQALNRHRMFSMATDLGNALEARAQVNGEANGEAEGEAPLLAQAPAVACPKPAGDCCPMNVANSCSACGMSGGGCGCLFAKAPVVAEAEAEEAEEAAMYDPYGFMGCDKPQPQEVDLVLPPQPPVQTQVAAVMNQQCAYQGPQGMQHPHGYPGTVYGANYGVCDAEL